MKNKAMLKINLITKTEATNLEKLREIQKFLNENYRPYTTSNLFANYHQKQLEEMSKRCGVYIRHEWKPIISNPSS